MERILPWLALAFLSVGSLQAADTIPAANERYAKEGVQETPDFQRHVLPLLTRLGCNGRACHGSFQGRGGFRLSLFGYDFNVDHDALMKSTNPRVKLDKPEESLILRKPTLAEDHEGGKRMEPNSWQYRLLEKWIRDGAKPRPSDAATFSHLEVTPREFTFAKAGQKTQLKVVAHWSDGGQEDVTPLCRYRTNDESIAKVNDDGVLECVAKGDTDIICIYDNGVVGVKAMLPVSNLTGKKYPSVPTPTRVDALVVAKLQKLGMVPSDLADDAEFLRRVSVDITGTLPTPAEIEAFLADKNSNKRASKIDELLERPGYAAWWATRLSDFTGNNGAAQADQSVGQDQSKQWYEWLRRRIEQNVPYDQIAEGIVLATSREGDETFEEYCEKMSSYYRTTDGSDFAKRHTMPHFWTRRQNNQPKDMALRFAHSFLGVRLQCAECHKHPFDQWTKQDFDQFTAFFNRITYNTRPEDRARFDEVAKAAPQDPKKKNNNKNNIDGGIRKGGTAPFRELYILPAKQAANANRKGKPVANNKKQQPAGRVITPKLLGGEEVGLDTDEDPRAALLDWMRRQDNPYFARVFVNRVWANYFGVGIVDPPDDQSLANPPSNPELLEHLVSGFIEHNYDMKWLHREIAGSRTYQLSWKTNATNELDGRNFSHALPRRMPAEVLYDALYIATASNDKLAELTKDVSRRAIGPAQGGAQLGKGQRASYAMTVFGKPPRSTDCDCERNSEPSLLQTLFMRNDQEIASVIDRPDGWVAEIGQKLNPKAAGKKNLEAAQDRKARRKQNAEPIADAPKNAEPVKTEAKNSEPVKNEPPKANGESSDKPAVATGETGAQKTAAASALTSSLVREAYLRILNRVPAPHEQTRSEKYLDESANMVDGLRDLVWALVNTKEFIVNH